MAALIELARTSGNLLLIDAPRGAEVSCDFFSFEPGPSCLGVKLLTPGIHLLASAPCADGVRSWLWFEVLQGGSTHVARWSNEDEAFAIVASAPQTALPCVCGSANDEALMHAARNLELDARLGVLPADGVKNWTALTRHVSRDVTMRISPSSSKCAGSGGGGIPATADPPPSIAAEILADVMKTTTTTTTTNHVLAAAPHEFESLSFSSIRGMRVTDGPAARAAHALDTSYALLEVAAAAAAADNNEATLLGEFEAAFVLTLIAQSFAALEAWKGLADAACRASDLLVGRKKGHLLGPSFFISLFTVLNIQLHTLPPHFFGADIAQGVFLGPALSSLLRSAREAARDTAETNDALINIPAVRIAVGKLLSTAQEHCAWKPQARGAVEDVCALAAGRQLEVAALGGGTEEAINLQALLQALIEEGGDEDGPAIVCQD